MRRGGIRLVFSLCLSTNKMALTHSNQFQKWTDIKPLYADARAAVMGDDI